MQRSPAPKVELDKALKSIIEMESAKSLDDFEESWKSYLFRLERCFNKAQAHYKKSPKWDAWWGTYKRLRASDDLLAYLVNARGAEEHSVEEIVGRDGGGIGIKAADGNSVHIESMSIDGRGNIHIRSPQTLRIDFIPEKMTLLPVLNRGRVYAAPLSHLGKPINPGDVCANARLAHSFYAEFLLSAEQYFVK